MSSRKDKGKSRMLLVPMERGQGSASSARSSSGNSEWSHSDDNYVLSPGLSPMSSTNEASPIFNTPRANASGHPQQQSPCSGILSQSISPASEVPLDVPEAALPLFDIERDGDPRIEWFMYYKFTVTKHNAFWKLLPGYLPSTKYPSIRPAEKVKRKSGKRCHRCEVIGCRSKPFSRHYDLERHVNTVHADDDEVNNENHENRREVFYCDYPRCPHTDPLVRKDHCREHYREYHQEDLIKRGHDAKSRVPLEQWLEGRKVVVAWWRCTRCLRRVTSGEPWFCVDCNISCEPERVRARRFKFSSSAAVIPYIHNNDPVDYEQLLPRLLGSSVGDSRTQNQEAEPYEFSMGCGHCQNGFLETEKPDDWIPCFTCQPDAYDTSSADFIQSLYR